MPLHVSSTCAHRQKGKIALHSLWYHHTYRCDDTRGCVMQFLPPDDEHVCSKHVEAWNKFIVKQKCCASSWLVTEIKYTEMHGQQNVQKCKWTCPDSCWNARKIGCCPSGMENIYEIHLPSVATNMNAVILLSSLHDYTARHNITKGHKYTQTFKYGHYSLTTPYDVSRMMSLLMWY